MKVLPVLAMTAAGLYLVSKLTTASAAGRINFTIANIGISNAGVTPILNLQVLAQNPTNSSFTINSIVANVFVNGRQVGNVAGFVPVTVEANQQSAIPLTVMLQGASLFSDVVSMLSGTSGLQVLVQLTGTANVDNLLLPINLSYQLI